MKWQCQNAQLAKTKRSCQESAWPDAAADVPCVPSRATVCLCVWAEVGGERAESLPRHSHTDANLTHAWVLPTVCVTLSAALVDLWGSVFFSCFVLRCHPMPSWELAPACGRPAHQQQYCSRWYFLKEALAPGLRCSNDGCRSFCKPYLSLSSNRYNATLFVAHSSHPFEYFKYLYIDLSLAQIPDAV